MPWSRVQRWQRGSAVTHLDRAGHKIGTQGAEVSNKGRDMCTQAHIDMHRHTDRHTQAHTGTYRHTQAHTGTHRHTQAHTGTHRHTQAHTGTHRHTQAHTGTHTGTHRHKHCIPITCSGRCGVPTKGRGKLVQSSRRDAPQHNPGASSNVQWRRALVRCLGCGPNNST
jgi:hypothetical protein